MIKINERNEDMTQVQKDFGFLYIMIMFLAGITFSLIQDQIDYYNEQIKPVVDIDITYPDIKKSMGKESSELFDSDKDSEAITVETLINASAYTCFSRRERRSKPHGYIKGKGYRRTASGTICEAYKSAAVDPRYIPFGTRIYNPVYKRWFVADDTGNEIKGNMIDFAVPNEQIAFSFGRDDYQMELIFVEPIVSDNEF